MHYPTPFTNCNKSKSKWSTDKGRTSERTSLYYILRTDPNKCSGEWSKKKMNTTLYASQFIQVYERSWANQHLIPTGKQEFYITAIGVQICSRWKQKQKLVIRAKHPPAIVMKTDKPHDQLQKKYNDTNVTKLKMKFLWWCIIIGRKMNNRSYVNRNQNFVQRHRWQLSERWPNDLIVQKSCCPHSSEKNFFGQVS